MSQNSTNQPRRPSRSDVTTYVYRFFRADGALLYIGVTSDLNHRFQAHQKKPWWGQVDYSTVAAHGNRALALAAEAMAILEEKPPHNIQRPNRARVDELQDRAFGTPVKETSPYDPVSVLARAHDRIEALESDLRTVRAALRFVTADRTGWRPKRLPPPAKPCPPGTPNASSLPCASSLPNAAAT